MDAVASGVRSRVVTGREGERVARPPADPHCQRLPTPKSRRLASRRRLRERRSRRWSTRTIRDAESGGRDAGSRDGARCRTDGKKTIGEKSGRPPQSDKPPIEGVGVVRTSATRAGDANRRHRSGGGHGVGHDSRHVSSVRARVVHVTLTWIRLGKQKGP